jgi:hypothetical protein
MKNSKIILFSLVIGILLTFTSIIRNELQSVPDLVIINLGFPLPWLLHQTVSIAGSVDIWSVQVLNLMIDFVFWLMISATIVFVWNKYKKSYTPSNTKS